MGKARIRPAAAADLEDIVRYLHQRSESAADQFLAEFYRSSQVLAGMPRLGAIRQTSGKLKGLRSWPLTPFGPYVIFYLPLADHLQRRNRRGFAVDPKSEGDSDRSSPNRYDFRGEHDS
jgi:plasmid stabilization system protein ParE